MNTAVIFAGGTGKRMNSKTVPKQFLKLYGKPIIIYTLEKFSRHDRIDQIVIVCLAAWIPQMQQYLEDFNIQKVVAIVPGGENGQDSILNGLKAAREHGSDEDIVLIHDGVRPLVDPATISMAISCTEAKGNAITTAPAIETIFLDNSEDGMVGTILDRSQCQMARAPQCFHLGDMLHFHELAKAEKRHDFIDSASMAKYYGMQLYTIEGRSENIKITTPIDFYIFRAIIDARENSQIFG